MFHLDRSKVKVMRAPQLVDEQPSSSYVPIHNFALQNFRALTFVCIYYSDRYSEQVIPLLVQAQRRLTQGIQELGGKAPPQPHYQQLMFKLNTVITAKTYLTQQLEIVMDKNNPPAVALGAGIDPLGHGLYTSKDALKNISVPLDVPQSLSVLYENFDKTQYTSRALQHSRKLLLLYLANQQNSE